MKHSPSSSSQRGPKGEIKISAERLNFNFKCFVLDTKRSSDKTGVQLNQGHTSTDDFIPRKYVLSLLRDEKTRNRLIEEHRACPVGRAPHKGQPMVDNWEDAKEFMEKYNVRVF